MDGREKRTPVREAATLERLVRRIMGWAYAIGMGTVTQTYVEEELRRRGFTLTKSKKARQEGANLYSALTRVASRETRTNAGSGSPAWRTDQLASDQEVTPREIVYGPDDLPAGERSSSVIYAGYRPGGKKKGGISKQAPYDLREE